MQHKMEPRHSSSSDDIEELDTVNPLLTESMYIIKNIDTGESIDIRGMNKQNFISDLSRITDSDDYDTFYSKQRKMNE